MSDLIDRQAAVDALKNRWKKTRNYEGIGDDIAEECELYLKQLPSAQPRLITEIQNGIKATDANDAYSCGMRNGMRWCISLIDDKEPLYEKCPSAQPNHIADIGKKVDGDCISRQAAIDCVTYDVEHTIECLKALSSAQPERDIPIKPYETTDTAWGIPHRQAVCPKCDYYLGHVAFLGDYKGKKVTYCETCGQAIDWEGWDSDEWGGEEK